MLSSPPTDTTDRRYLLLVQVPAVVLLGLLALWALGPAPALLPALYLAVVTPELVRVDLRSRRLPNVLVLPGYGVLAAVAGICWVASGAVLWAVPAATGAAFLFLLLMNVLGGMGMGDVKLGGVLAGALAVTSLEAAAAGIAAGFLLGGVASVCLLLRRGIIGGLTRAQRSIPFGPYLLAGYWLVVVISAGPVVLDG
jgi:leader peptidase (prepilin peptidase)/N-methyltransferase